ncbi:hypothetical protein NQ318_019856, partial [Aromia moschata]
YISGISILGIPAEMYTYGTQFWMIIASEGFVSLAMAYGYLPVFYKLQITSSYEYLNLRFNQTVRLLGSILFLTKMLLYIPIVIYVPALAFSQVTGINLHLVTPVVCVVCIFYTTLVRDTPRYYGILYDCSISPSRKRRSLDESSRPGTKNTKRTHSVRRGLSNRTMGDAIISSGSSTDIMSASISIMSRASSSSMWPAA